MLKENNRLNKR